jgi:hypothetical protein
MDLDLLGRLGWREGLIAIIVLLVLYIVVLFVRMRRLRDSAMAMPSPAGQSAVAAYTAIQESESDAPSAQDRSAVPQQPADRTAAGGRRTTQPQCAPMQASAAASPGTSRRPRFPARKPDRRPAARRLPVALRGRRVAQPKSWPHATILGVNWPRLKGPAPGRAAALQRCHADGRSRATTRPPSRIAAA